MSLPPFINSHSVLILKKLDHAVDHIKLAQQGVDEDFNKREAVRLAYYALFQFVSLTCSLDTYYDLAPTEVEWVKLFRSFDHKDLKNKLIQAKSISETHRKLASVFEQLQEARNLADYDLRVFEKSTSDVYDLLKSSAEAYRSFNNIPLLERRKFSLSLLIKDRR